MNSKNRFGCQQTMAIFVKDAQFEKELKSLQIEVRTNIYDLSLIEKECILAIINPEETEWRSIIDLIAELSAHQFFIFIITDSMNREMFDRLRSLNGALIRAEQLKWLLRTDRETNILTLLEKLSKSFPSYGIYERNKIRHEVSKIIQANINNSGIYETN